MCHVLPGLLCFGLFVYSVFLSFQCCYFVAWFCFFLFLLCVLVFMCTSSHLSCITLSVASCLFTLVPVLFWNIFFFCLVTFTSCVWLSHVSHLTSRFPHLCLVCNHSPCIYCPVFSSVSVESTAFILFLFYVYSMFIPCSWLVFLCLCLLRFWYVPVTSALNISASDLACLPSLHLGPPAPLTHLHDTMWDSWTLRFCFGACLKS